MKGKLLTTAVLAALLVGGNAMASIARLAVMGSQPVITTAGTSLVTANVVNGSLWYDDEYNVFYNPSYINDNKNYVTVNKGAEGGFFKGEFENFAYGIYFNRSTFTQANTVAPGITGKSAFTGGSGGGPVSTQRPIDFFIGGDTGIKWGAHIAWAYNRTEAVATATQREDELTARYWHADIGAQIMGLEPFVGLTFMTKAQNNIVGSGTNLGQQNLDEFNIGTRYKYEGWSPYIAYKIYREAGSPVGGVAGSTSTMLQTSVKSLNLGVGHDTKVADGVHINKHIGFVYASVMDDTAGTSSSNGTATNRDFKQYILPMNVTLEADATSWLTLRAGVAYDFWNERKQARLTNGPNAAAEGTKTSQTGTTTFRLGSTLKFGKLSVDSAFGNGSGAATAALDSSNNIGFDSQLFALVSAAYHW